MSSVSSEDSTQPLKDPNPVWLSCSDDDESPRNYRPIHSPKIKFSPAKQIEQIQLNPEEKSKKIRVKRNFFPTTAALKKY